MNVLHIGDRPVSADAEASLGDGMAEAAADRYVTARRHLHAGRTIKEVETLTHDMMATLRPSTGTEVRDLEHLIGRIARPRIERHEPLAWAAH